MSRWLHRHPVVRGALEALLDFAVAVSLLAAFIAAAMLAESVK